MQSLLSKLLTVAFVVVGLADNAQANSSAAPPNADAIAAARTECEKFKKDDPKTDIQACMKGLLFPSSGEDYNSCKDIQKNLTDANIEFSSACRGAGINGNCRTEIDRCFSAVSSSQKSTADAILESLGLAGINNAPQQAQQICRTQTGEQYEKEQERIQEEMRQAREDLDNAQTQLHESRQKIAEADAQKSAAEQEAKNAMRQLELAVPQNSRLEHEETFKTLHGIRTSIDNAKNQKAELVRKVAEVQSKKATELLALLGQCENQLTEKRNELRQQYEKAVADRGGVAQVRGFNDIYRSSQPLRQVLERHYRRCMEQANKIRTIRVNEANSQIVSLEKQIQSKDNEIARLEEAMEMEKTSLEQRIGEIRLEAEINRLNHVETYEAAQRNLQNIMAIENQRQQDVYGQIQDAQARLNMTSNGMMGLGNQQTGLSGLFATVLGGIAGNNGAAPGSPIPASAYTNTIFDVMKARSKVEEWEKRSQEHGCSGSGSSSTRSAGDTLE